LPKDSVANASQVVAVNRAFLAERVARLAPKQLTQVLHGIDVLLGR
jgi:mRNA-degrading endonuclease toxin of MazEF toxin-antitoxin module